MRITLRRVLNMVFTSRTLLNMVSASRRSPQGLLKRPTTVSARDAHPQAPWAWTGDSGTTATSDVLQTGRRGIIRASPRVLLIGRCVDDGKNGFV